MNLIHTRFSKDSGMVFSKLTLPWLQNYPDLYGGEPLNCIPIGIYKCVPYFSPHRQEDTWLLQDVPGFDFIEIHSGNFGCATTINGLAHKSDTEGCLMYGFSLDEKIPMLLKSMPAIRYLHTIIGLKSSFGIEVREEYI